MYVSVSVGFREFGIENVHLVEMFRALGSVFEHGPMGVLPSMLAFSRLMSLSLASEYVISSNVFIRRVFISLILVLSAL